MVTLTGVLPARGVKLARLPAQVPRVMVSVPLPRLSLAVGSAVGMLSVCAAASRATATL